MKRLMIVLAVLAIVSVGVAFARDAWTRVVASTATVYYNTTTTKTFTGVQRAQMQIQTAGKQVYYSVDSGAGTTPSGYWCKLVSSGATDTGILPPTDLPVKNNGVLKVNLSGVATNDTNITVYFWIYQ